MQRQGKFAKTATFSEPLRQFQRAKDFSHESSSRLYGKRAAAWLSIWDKGGTFTRLGLLEAFILLHGKSNVSMLMDDLGDAAALFLTRIVSWLRLSYLRLLPSSRGGQRRRLPLSRGAHRSAAAAPALAKEDGKGHGGEGKAAGEEAEKGRRAGPLSCAADSPPPPPTPLLALVEAITIFSRGSVFLSQLAECGVVSALVDCLKRGGGEVVTGGMADEKAADKSRGKGEEEKVEEEGSRGSPRAFVPISMREKKAIVLLLLYIANAGRVYRELICDEEGVSDLLIVFQREEDAEVAALLTELFITLGNGVPRLGLHVQCGLLRLILAERDLEERLAAPQAGKKEVASTPDHLNTPGHIRNGGWSAADVRQAFALASESFRESILQAARSLRGLQLNYESRYFGGIEEQNLRFSATDDHSQMVGEERDQVPVICLGGNYALSHRGDSLPSLAFPPSQEQSQSQSLGHDTPALLANSSSRQSRQGAGEDAAQTSDGGANGLLRPVILTELLEGLFFLAKHECSSRYRVEGSELLTLVAKNINLTQPILNYSFDVLNDNDLAITDDEADFSLIRQQRRQLCCGRVAVQVILSKPMTSRRHALIIKLIAIRSAHLSLLKYLRMTDQSDTASVLDCCMALQIVARASNAAQHARMLAPPWLSEDPNDDENDNEAYRNERIPQMSEEDELELSLTPTGGRKGFHGNALLRVGHAIRDALGDSLYQVVLYQKLSEEECFAMQRACRDAAFTMK